ncbi:MAG: phosphoenolpyruvate--protein phosphotransferase [Candidatus Faecousia sp.]|nr:phosphoenolpyruvate--protein phosphotransferase [Bacillota bacterium]MDY2809786.1 phosphoenolpyruvate--protein phosphotransferase [Candidatus Faecousia sp.]
MKHGIGLPVYPGVAMGKPLVYRKPEAASSDVGTPEAEALKFHRACQEAKNQLSALAKIAREGLGGEQAEILEVQVLMLEDGELLEGVEAAIASGASAAEAVQQQGEAMAQDMAALDDDYLRGRAADIRDAAARVTGILRGSGTFSFPEGKFLLLAEDLAPSETVRLPRDRVLGLVTRQGSANSHTAILARTLKIPTLVQADMDLKDGENAKILAIDASCGEWFLDPDEETLARLKEKQSSLNHQQTGLDAYRDRETVTASGRKIQLFANVGSAEDVAEAQAVGAEGIGLYRSEFLYLGREKLPSEEELFEAYRTAAERMKGRSVIIRTLDIGADKQASYLNLPAEENPALGLRGLRLCLAHPELFLPQLRAIYRASAYGNLSLMFPMVTSLWELQEAKRLCTQVCLELEDDGVAYREIPIGIMIETPAAALEAREFAKEADFLSVGTNDLTQYTLAQDRQNAALERFFDPCHPALLKLLRSIAEAAGQAGIWAGICGELAGDATLAGMFLDMGYRELSMAPGRILEVRKTICEREETP